MSKIKPNNQLNISYIDLEQYTINSEIVTLIPESISRRYNLIAIDKKDDFLIVAMTDPLNIFALDDIKMFSKYEVKPIVATKESILKNINKYYRKSSTENVLYEFTEYYKPKDNDKLETKETLEIITAPVVKLINSIIIKAIDINASDIHIEPYINGIKIRFRVDGDLQEVMNLSKAIYPAITTRLKIMGNMNIAENRIPQDGRTELKMEDKEIDIRISTLPTVNGEKFVLRLLNRKNIIFSKSELGLTKSNLILFNNILKQPSGLILITGPTGSGKTTTMYAILNELNKIEKNIITIEDPVEFKLEGINQVQINTKAGLSFANGLRAILRQDPDIVMIGEIRDSETAKIAVRAAITGHLVLSTLHTNDSTSSIIRLIDMGVEPYMLSSALIGVISQRLVKKLCANCKIPYKANYLDKSILGLNKNDNIVLYKSGNCTKCNKGYKGRRAIHEILVINEEIRQLIDNKSSIDDLRKAAIKNGTITLLDNSTKITLAGLTTVEEALKASYVLN